MLYALVIIRITCGTALITQDQYSETVVLVLQYAAVICTYYENLGEAICSR